GFTYDLGDRIDVFDAILGVSAVDENGQATAQLEFHLFQPLDHPDAGEVMDLDNIRFEFQVTAVDDDGDPVTQTVFVDVDDDGPRIFEAPTALVDEDGLSGGLAGGVGDDAVPDVDGDGNEATTSGSLNFTFGADGPGGALDFAALDGTVVMRTGDDGEQILTSRGEQVIYSWDGATMTLTGLVPGDDSGGEVGEGGIGVDRVIFELTITDATSGAYTFTLHDVVDHPTSGTEDNVVLDIPFTLTDADGDSATGTLSVSIDDDTPTIDGGEGGTDMFVQESDIVDGAFASVTYAFGADGPDPVTPLSLGFVGAVAVDELGTEGGEVPWALTTPAGDAIVVSNLDALSVVGKVEGTDIEVFRATLDATTGEITFTLSGPIAHPDAGETGFLDRVRLDFDAAVRDGDGDTATRRVTVTVDDDGPVAFDDMDMVVENSEIGTWGNVITGVDPDLDPDAQGVLAADDAGADGVGVIRSLTHDGVTFTLNEAGDDVTASDPGALYSFSGGILLVETALGGTLFITLTGPEVGEYNYVPPNDVDNSNGDPVENFTYVLEDGDGDGDAATLSITVKSDDEPVFVVGSNENDDADAANLPAFQHTVPNPLTGSTFGPVNGLSEDDLLVGDPGGVLQAASINVVYVLDVSGSMGSADDPTSKLSLAKSALENLTLRFSMLAENGADVKLHIIRFRRTAEEVETINNLGSPGALAAALLAIDGLSGDGLASGTNYQAALDLTRNFLGDTTSNPPAEVNTVYFLSDGIPNRGDTEQGISDFQDFIDDYTTDGGVIDPGARLDVHAFGIDVGVDALAVLDPIDNTVNPNPDDVPVSDGGPGYDGAELIDDPNDISATLDATFELASVGEDVIVGSDGDDIIYGDVPNTDQLAEDQGLNMLDGSGWDVFEALESGDSAVSPDWDRTDTINYLSDPLNFAELTAGDRGEADLIDGGGGDDIIFGQGGDDTIIGGTGADELWGGAGADIYVYEPGDGGSTIAEADVIHDFDDGVDLIGLGGGLTSADITIGDDGSGNAVISTTSGEVLAVLIGVSPADITDDDLTPAPIV
ncbi:MAG: VWA domain-containing protein, partial [Alphaproteobacteria bacterium]